MHSLCQTKMLAKVHFSLLIKLARQTEISKCKLLTKWQASIKFDPLSMQHATKEDFMEAAEGIL